MARVVKGIAIALGVVIIIAVAALAWLASGAGLPFVIGQAESFINGRGDGSELRIQGAQGSLWSGVRLASLHWSDGSTTVETGAVDTGWSLSGLLQRRLMVSRAHVDELRVVVPRADPSKPPSPRQAVPMPGSWALPIALQVDDVRVGRLLVSNAGAESATVVVDDIAVAVSYEAQKYHVSNLRLATQWADLKSASLVIGADAPHALTLEAGVEGPLPGATAKADRFGMMLRADGDLNVVAANASLDMAAIGSTKLRAVLSPLAASPLASADLDFNALILEHVVSDAPQATLSGKLKLRVPGSSPATATTTTAASKSTMASATTTTGSATHWQLELYATNARPGPLDRNRLPMQSISFLAHFDDPLAGPLRALVVDQLDLKMPGTRATAAITGNLSINLEDRLTIAGTELPSPKAVLQVKDLDLAFFGLREIPTALGGHIDIDRNRFTIDLKQTAAKSRPAEKANANTVDSVASRVLAAKAAIDVSGRLNASTLTLDRAQVSLADAAISAKGTLATAAPVIAKLSGDIRNVELQRWIPASVDLAPRWRDGRLSGTWRVDGQLTPALDTRFELKLADSRLAGKPVSADVSGRVSKRAGDTFADVRDLKTGLRWGDNQLQAHGALGKRGDRLELSSRFNEPGLLDPRLSGRITLNGVISGAFDDLRANLDGRARQLRWRDGDTTLTLASVNVAANVPLTAEIAPDAALDLKVGARGLKFGSFGASQLDLVLDGRLDAHRMRLTGVTDPGKIALTLAGGLALGREPAWRGVVTQLAFDGKTDLGSEQDIALLITPQSASLSRAHLRVDATGGRNGRIVLDELVARFTPQAGTSPLVLRGSIETLPIADLVASFTGEKLPSETQRLRLSSRFDLQGSGPADLSGMLAVDLQELPGDGARLLSNANNEIQLRFDAGRIDGRVDISLPSLAFSRRFTGPDWQLDGSMSLTGAIGGTLAAPMWDATLKGSDLSLLQPALGWHLDRGVLQARVEGRELKLDTLSLRTREGKVELDGQAQLLDTAQQSRKPTDLPLRGSFRLRTEGFIVPIGPGQQLVLSGASSIIAADGGLAWKGKMNVDRGLIEIAGSGAPSLPDDVQIVDASKPEDASALKPTGGTQPGDENIAVATSLTIDLGKDLRVIGGGVNARLAGELLLQGTLPANPRVDGTVKIVDGSYTAYSQDLKITDGTVSFNGPIDNPSLNIEAERPNLPVEVGVAIRGTALSPRVELYSGSSLTDAEKLSWLVLGQPIANAQGGAQTLALKEAASRLIGQDDGSISGGGFADKLGLDNLGFGFSSDTGQAQGVRDSGQPTGLPGAGGRTSQENYQEVVSLGKRLSDRLTVSYEQGVRGVYNLLRVQYELNKRLSLRAQTGTESAVDLLYFWSFD